jgi:small-conductance mechanosensitive channel
VVRHNLLRHPNRKAFDAQAVIAQIGGMTASNTISPAAGLQQVFDTDLTLVWSSLSLWISSHSKQIVTAAIIGALIIGSLYALKLLGLWLCRPERSGEQRQGGQWPVIIGKALSRTRVWFMIGVAGQIISALANAPAAIGWPVYVIFITVMGVQIAIWLRALVLGAVQHRAAQDDPSGSLGSAVGIIRLLVTASLFLLAAILILSNLGVNVSGLLAGLGIGGIAIGLAAQGIFSDLFAALSILFDKPFRRGDMIRWETTIGHVEYIGLKSTRIRALSGEEIIISNANLLGKELRNFARIESRRVNQILGLVFHTPRATCAALPALLEPAINACEGCHFQRVGLETFGASSLDFMLVYDIMAEDQADILERRNAVNLSVLAVFEAEGIAFAYPTQTTYTAAPDGRMVMPWAKPIKA